MFSVIFDMDGTLLDSQGIYIPAWDYAGENQGVSGMGKHILTVCGMNEKGWTDYLIKNSKDLDIAKFKGAVRYFLNVNDKTKLKKGAMELLQFLKANNIKMAVASGSETASVIERLKEVGALNYFDAFTGGSDVKNGKPAPDIFLRAASLIDAKPEECFVFEDSVNGILAGTKASMKCIGVPDIVRFPDEIKKILFAELDDLSQGIPLLKKYI